MPQLISQYWVLPLSFEAVTSGGTRIKARGLRDRNACTQPLLPETLLMFGFML